MAEMWLAGEEVVNTMRDLVARHHPHLATIVDNIAILFKDKATMAGNKVVIGKSAKASPVIVTLTKKPWRFIFTLAADEWQKMEEKNRVALLDHLLCGCKGEEDEKSGEMNFFLQPPDVEFYKEEVLRHGLWRTSGVAPTPDLIKELFGS